MYLLLCYSCECCTYIYYLFQIIYIFPKCSKKNYHKILLLTIQNFTSLFIELMYYVMIHRQRSNHFSCFFDVISLPFFFICHFNTTLFFKSQFLEIRGCRQTWIYVRMGKKTGTAFSTSCGQRSPWTTKDCGNWKEIQCYWRFYFLKNTFIISISSNSFKLTYKIIPKKM